MSVQLDESDSGLILAAEECPPGDFLKYHRFSAHDEVIIRQLTAHGPVLVRGGRGSGKSALMLAAYHKMVSEGNILPVYVSLRYLPLLQSDGDEYIGHFCSLLSQAVKQELNRQSVEPDFDVTAEQLTLLTSLARLSQVINKRLVLLFDDAAHIGREKPLEVFFDLFRTLSSGLISCKASIYPGVTKFGIRFDVFNDSTVIDIGRSDIEISSNFFPQVIEARYPKLSSRQNFSERFSPTVFANLLGRAVVGNMRGLILACNRISLQDRIGVPEVNKCLLEMATDYYWPLMEEVAPKLGVYEPLIEPAKDVMEALVEHACKPVKDKLKTVAQDRVLIHRQFASKFAKIFEILEYLGFVARRDASRALKSGGRGPVFALNLCSILDCIPSQRLTTEMIDEWIGGAIEPTEIHVNGNTFASIKLPSLPEEHGLAILEKNVAILAKSKVYPYGLTQNMIERLESAGITTVGAVAKTSDAELDDIESIGVAKIRRIREVVSQAIWM